MSFTSLVIIMLAARQNKLPDIIHRLLDYGEDPGGFRAGKGLLKNLKLLLVFWQEHYLHKDKDCSTLEKSSLIPFTFWKETVDQLVSENHSLPTSILHYIQVKHFPLSFISLHKIFFIILTYYTNFILCYGNPVL